MQGFMDGAGDYRFLYPKKPEKVLIYSDETIYGFLKNRNHPMVDVLDKIPQLQSIYNSPQKDCTLFVPNNISGFTEMEDFLALRKSIMYHTLDRPLSLDFLRSSGAMTVNTRLNGYTIMVENLTTNLPVLNRQAYVLDHVQVGDSNIIFINVCLIRND